MEGEVVELRRKRRDREEIRKARAERLRANKGKPSMLVDLDTSDDEACEAWITISAEIKELEVDVFTCFVRPPCLALVGAFGIVKLVH